MSKPIDDVELDDLLEPCGRCQDASATKPTKGTPSVVDQTREFSINDSQSCPMCHGSKRVLNKVGIQIRRLALHLRNAGYLRP